MPEKETTSYENESVNDLIVFGIYTVLKSGNGCFFERLVKECFALFPGAFCLNYYPDWPDSRKLDRPLRWLRKEKIVIGDPKTSFTLTKVGKERAIIIEKRLRQKKLNLF
ncbi:MAG: hypothetical protein V1905_02390 [bacterium]